MAGTFLRLLVVLCFSQLICLNAIPITRTGSLGHKSQGHGVLSANNYHMANAKKRWNMIRRMDVGLNDYPGPGANNRHTPTPRSQLGRGSCVDC